MMARCFYNRNFKLIPVFLFFSGCLNGVYAQEDSLEIKGLANVIHYSMKGQFWDMCQDKQGVLYLSNNEGTLIFDGQSWQRVQLPNNSSIRSLLVSKEGVVYAGGFNELGTIKRDRFGRYYYESLMHLLRAEDRNIENVWRIHEVQNHIVFRSFKALIAIANNKAVTLPTSSSFVLSSVVNNQLFVQDGEGVKSLDLASLSFRLLFKSTVFKGEDLVALIPGVENNECLAVTKPGSFFKIDTENDQIAFWQKILPPHANNLLTCAIKTSKGRYYIGTLRTKVMVLDALGKQVVAGQELNALQDNTVHNLFESNDGNIWAVLNNGIDCIDVNSPVTRLFEDASIYDALVHKEKLYIATNQGVFVSKNLSGNVTLAKRDFRNVEGLEGQAWTLHKLEDQIVCAHDKGIFVIRDNSVKKLSVTEGIWKVIPVKGKPHHYLACSYHGLHLVVYDPANGFVAKHKLEGFTESTRDILQADEPGVFWICHGYKGVFRIRIDDALKRIVSVEHFKENGLPSPFNINVAPWNNEIVFTTNHGIFKYEESQNRFVPHEFLTGLFGTELNVRKLRQYGDKTWFAHDNEIGYFITDSKNPRMEKDLFLQLKGTLNPSMECMVPANSHSMLIGTNEGLYAFDMSYDGGMPNVKTLITTVSYRDADSENEIPLDITSGGNIQLPYRSNNLVFRYATPSFQNKTNVQFSYRLDGVDNRWSAWNEASVKEYSLLTPGQYTFRVKSRSLLGEKGLEDAYRFEILPAWYQSVWAMIGYGVAGVLVVALSVGLVKHRIDAERRKALTEEREKRRLLELEIERMKLAGEKEKILKDKEQLEEDVIYKSKELVNYTMLLVKKRELLTELHDELKALKEMVRNDASRQAVRDLLRKISFNLESEEHLRVFEANFERVHHEFFTQLKANFPDLTQKELQLCAFVRMNLTNKEIASILNISVRGIETARYRLRKRLGMSHEVDMAEFLEKLHSPHDTPVSDDVSV